MTTHEPLRAGTLTDQFAEVTAVLGTLLAKLNAAITALPDNPRIERVSPQAFIMSSADLGNNWSVFHHDFPAQYRRVIEVVSTGNPAHAMEKLQQIIREGSIKPDGRLHSDVIAHLRTLL